MLRQFLLFISLLTFALPLHAQYDILDFHWQLTDIGFSYPATWDEPFAVQQFGVESVVLAQSDARNPERAPEVPLISLALLPSEERGTETVLHERMVEFNINPSVTIPTTILNQDGIRARGASRDESFIGQGAAIPWDDMILTIVGRAPTEQASLFNYNFDIVIRSLAQNQTFGEIVPFGLVWSNHTTIDEEAVAFTSISGVTLDEANQMLYAVDDFLGLLQFDRRSGRLESIIPNTDFDLPTDIAIGANNAIYVSDSGCQCIHIYQNNAWQEALTDFGEDAPLSIVTLPTGELYATQTDGFDISIRNFAPDEEANLIENPVINIAGDIEEQPLLFVTENQLHYLDPFSDEIIQVSDGEFTPITALQLESIPFTIDSTSDGSYITTSATAIEFYTADGIFINSLDSFDYSQASDIRALAIGNDSTLYFATSSLEMGEILAVSQRVPESRYGFQTLAPYRLSGGVLSEDNPADLWLIEGNNGDLLSLYSQGYSQLADFDYTTTLIAPDGSEVITVDASVDNRFPFDRSIENIELSANGIYEVRVNHVFSEGLYEIVLVSPKQFELDPDITTIYGDLSETHGKDVWTFEGDGRTVVTITIEAVDSTQLDVALQLLDSQLQQIAQNNDAESGQLDTNAQIVEFTLPVSGLYYLEAIKVDGVGKYKLTVDIIEPES